MLSSAAPGTISCGAALSPHKTRQMRQDVLGIITEAIDRWLDRRAERRIASQLRRRWEMQNGNTIEALRKLLVYVEEMQETIQLAMTGDTKALTEVIREYGGNYTTLQALCGEVGRGAQDDADELMSMLEAIEAEEEAKRVMLSERK